MFCVLWRVSLENKLYFSLCLATGVEIWGVRFSAGGLSEHHQHRGIE